MAFPTALALGETWATPEIAATSRMARMHRPFTTKLVKRAAVSGIGFWMPLQHRGFEGDFEDAVFIPEPHRHTSKPRRNAKHVSRPSVGLSKERSSRSDGC